MQRETMPPFGMAYCLAASLKDAPVVSIKFNTSRLNSLVYFVGELCVSRSALSNG